MKCALILLSLLAFCYSSPVSEGNHFSNGEDDVLKFLGHGRSIVLSKNAQNLEKNIEIDVGGTPGVHKRIHINEENNIKSVGVQLPQRAGENKEQAGGVEGLRDGRTPANILPGVFQHYQGVADEQPYYNQLEQVEAGSGYGIQQGNTPDVWRQNIAWQWKQPFYANRYVVPQFGESLLYKRVPVDSQYGGQYYPSVYGNAFNGQRDDVAQIDRASLSSVPRELLGLYKPHQKNYYQQWMNHFNYHQGVESENQGFKIYLQLINIQQSQLSPVQQEKVNILHQQWVSFQNQLSPEELQQLSYLYKQWINCEQVLSAEKYQCDKLYGEWISFQQRLSLAQRQLLSNIYLQWVAIQQELSIGQLSQLEQLWSNFYQRYVRFEQQISLEQQYQLSVILPRWLSYSQQRVVGEWSQLQHQEYNELRNELVKLYIDLSVEQQQELNDIYQICVIILRQQINPGEWIQVRQQLNSYMRQLVSGPQEVESVQNQYFLRLYQGWYNYVESLVYFEQGLQNIYQTWVLFQQQLNQAQLREFKASFPQWISLNVQRRSGIWSQLHEEQYEIAQNQWMAFQQQLSPDQQELLNNFFRGFYAIEQQNINGVNWNTLVHSLNVFVRRLIVSSQQDIESREQLEFYEFYQVWVESMSHRINVEQLTAVYGQSPQYGINEFPSGHSGLLQSSLWEQRQHFVYPQGRQSNVFYPWKYYESQKAQQNEIVPHQFYGAAY